MKKDVRFSRYAAVLTGTAMAVILAGCATTSTLIGKRNLDVQTKMSDSVFLTPVSPDKQTVYVQIRNTSDKPDLTIRDTVISNIRSHGYTVVYDPEVATYWLQVNILQAGKTDKGSADNALSKGFGGPLGTAALGAGTAAVVGVRDANTLGAAGLAAGAADYVGSLLVKDVYYTVITDVQISERIKPGRTVHVSGSQDLKQGSSGSEHQTYDEDRDVKQYRTRVMSVANQANLEWQDAQGELVNGLAQAIGGVF